MSTPRMAWTIRDTSGILIFQMPVPADRAALERDLLRDRAYTTLRDAIVDGTLQPGERLRDQELTEWLGLSRTPVRDALSRLEQDGLVETEPQRLTRVAALDPRGAGGAGGGAGRVPDRGGAARAGRGARRAAAHGRRPRGDARRQRALRRRAEGRRRRRRAGRRRRLPRRAADRERQRRAEADAGAPDATAAAAGAAALRLARRPCVGPPA